MFSSLTSFDTTCLCLVWRLGRWWRGDVIIISRSVVVFFLRLGFFVCWCGPLCRLVWFWSSGRSKRDRLAARTACSCWVGILRLAGSRSDIGRWFASTGFLLQAQSHCAFDAAFRLWWIISACIPTSQELHDLFLDSEPSVQYTTSHNDVDIYRLVATKNIFFFFLGAQPSKCKIARTQRMVHLLTIPLNCIKLTH